MKIEKLTNNTYRVRKMFKGNTYAVYFDHKPTQKEAMNKLVKEMDISLNENNANNKDFKYYAEQFIKHCEKNDYSPSTVRGYRSIINNMSEKFLRHNFYDINNKIIGEEVNTYSKNRSPKSTRNFYGFIRSVFSEYRPEFNVKVNLPKTIKKFEYEPTTKDVSRILEYSKGSRYELALRLASIGLRRGEALAITIDDIDQDNVLTINKDLVLDANNNYIIKNTAKTEVSNRRIKIPDDIADMLREKKTVFDGNPHTINEYLHKCQDALEIPRFRLHILRHFCAAYLLKQGFTSEQIKSYMGWEKGSNVMEKVYSYNLDPAESQNDISNSLSELAKICQ